MILAWWLVGSLLGLIALPLTYRIFHRLPDRGYAFARPLGMMVPSYVLWLGASLGFMPNNLGGALGAVLVLAVIGALVLRGSKENLQDIIHWLKTNRRMVLTMEAVFLVSYLVWAFVRANNPEIQFTEKPMELAFLNGILRSDSFPPLDPWLSDYGISYYYFGYVMIALMTLLSGAASSLAFNLANAMWFALVALASYSILFNLLAVRAKKRSESAKQLAASGADRSAVGSVERPVVSESERPGVSEAERPGVSESERPGVSEAEWPSLVAPLLAPIFVLIAGNLEGFLDVLHSQHVFWEQLPDGDMVSAFWKWLDLKQLSEPPAVQASWIPQRHLWWWRASRVVRDVNLAGGDVEVIDEFPFFSFLLADNHPHLLAMPFAMMAVAFSLQIFLGGPRGALYLRPLAMPSDRLKRIGLLIGAVVIGIILTRAVVSISPLAGKEALSILEAIQRASIEILLAVAGIVLIGGLVLVLIGALPISLRSGEFAFAAWLFGGLAFLNTWDSPIYLVLLLATLAWASMRDRFSAWGPRILYTGLAVGAAAFLLYLPWWTSFSSQAGGVLSNVLFPTRFQHFVVMFGVSFIPIAIWLVWLARGIRERRDLIWKVGLGSLVALLLASIVIGGANYVVLLRSPQELETVLRGLGVGNQSLQDGVRSVLQVAVDRRLTLSWTALALSLTVGAGFWLLFISGKKEEERKVPSAWPFVVLLIGIGALLVLAPEFVYLRDRFGTRMNTVFKFYFAAWILWAIAAAYASVELWPAKMRIRHVGRVAIFFPLVLGLVYPLLATWTKTSGFRPVQGRTLDGVAYLARERPADYEAIRWINEKLTGGVIAEAIGGSYSQYARVSTHTGLPTVLGWGGHEIQWRRDASPQGSRQADVQRLYETADWSEAVELMDKYGIDYVYVGPLELSTYLRLNEGKFEAFMDKIYENGEVRIYSRGMAG